MQCLVGLGTTSLQVYSSSRLQFYCKIKSTALIVYALLVLGTVVWGLWEVGSDFFALAPRLDILGLFGLLLLIPAVTRGFDNVKVQNWF